MKTKRMLSMILVCAILSLSLCGCNSAVKVNAETITLSQTQIELAEGETHTIYAEVYPTDADSVSVKWTSTNEDVATVSHGTITAKDTGSCKVYATNSSGDITAICDVVVSDNFLRVNSSYSKEQSGYGTQFFATITEAIAYAGEDSVIIVEEGEYDEYVNITKSVIIKGQNAVITGAFVIGYPALDDGVEDIEIDGFTFNVGAGTSLDQFAGIYIGNDADDVFITNCTFVGEYSGGEVPAWNQDGITIGIYAIPSSSKTAGEDIEITSCTFENLDYAIMFMPYVSKTEIISCSFQTCGFAMRFAGSQKITVENNTLADSGFIQFGFSENLADMVEVNNNVISSYPEYNLVEATAGTVDAGFTLDLSDNTFVGLKPCDMTLEEFEVLARKIVGAEEDGVVTNIKLASSKELKEIYG
ncbi:MAG: Ig-like domain-containing protein [Bacillota bacterium]